MKGKQNQSGQILLITLLVLTVATTIALSVIGRSTSDEAISTQLEESARAFSAAEAGIEEALRSGRGTTSVLTSGPSYTVTVGSIGGATGIFQFPRKTPVGIAETLWLVNHNTDGTLDETRQVSVPSMTVCWSAEATVPALSVSVLYKSSSDGSYRTARAALDPDATRAATNKFTGVSPAGTNCALANNYQQTIPFASLGITPAVDTLLAIRLRPLYADTRIAIDPLGATMPSQGNRIESVGSTNAGVSRKVVVYQQYRSPESVFDASIVSQSSFGH